MSLSKKILLLSSLFLIKLVTTACDLGTDDSYSSGSSGSSGSSSYSLLPIIHDTNYNNCNDQTAAQCAAADVRYDQYEECMSLYNGDPSCNGYYDNYEIQAGLCNDFQQNVGCK